MEGGTDITDQGDFCTLIFYDQSPPHHLIRYGIRKDIRGFRLILRYSLCRRVISHPFILYGESQVYVLFTA